VGELADCGLVIEAIVEDLEAKATLLAELGDVSKEADLASSTSSLSIGQLAERSGHGTAVSASTCSIR